MRNTDISIYRHREYIHNLKSPEKIVSRIMEVLKPTSVLDIGCGIGTFLHCFKKHGVQDILGLDGNWVDMELLKKYIGPEEFRIHNLSQRIRLGRKFDLVVCVEVAEHLPDEKADLFVENIVEHGDVVLFSAAVPGQGGQNHVNEQWPGYWMDKFAKHDYVFMDVVRPMIWHESDVFFWYRQNAFLVVRKDLPVDAAVFNKHQRQIWDIVHPQLLHNCRDEHEAILQGDRQVRFYFNLFWKAIGNRLRGKTPRAKG